MESKMSSKPVVQKLGLKPNHKAIFLHIPKEISKLVTPPKGVKPLSKFSGKVDFILGFYESAKELKNDLSKIPKILVKNGIAWICWRKGNVTDLHRDSIWSLAKDAG